MTQKKGMKNMRVFCVRCASLRSKVALRRAWFRVTLVAFGLIASLLTIVSGYAAFVTDVVVPENRLLDARAIARAALQEDIVDLVRGYPIERMAPYIAKQDRLTAAYLVSIAKKESNWGKHVPLGKNGEECFNYWGYRDPDDTSATGGHTCFTSPDEAVTRVGARIHELAYEEHRDTPSEMIVWKCGYSCDGHSPESVSKWKRDVAFYFQKMMPTN